MSVPSILSRIQALEATTGFPNGVTTSTSSSSGPSGGVTLLSAPVSVASQSGTGALAATWYNAAGSIPASATSVVLRVHGSADGSGPASIVFGPTNLLGWKTWTQTSSGVDTDIEGNAALWTIPCQGQGFYYSWSSAITSIDIELWGYQ